MIQGHDRRLRRGGERVEAKLYEGMGHATVGLEVRDLRGWLERVVPENEA